MNLFDFQGVAQSLRDSKTTHKDIQAALKRFGNKRVLLVGDLILDIYTECTAIGKTAKTPTLSVKRGKSNYYWGGSSLICNNLLELGASVTFIAVTGDDWGHEFFMKKSHPRLTSKFFKDPSRPTTLKERFWVDGYKLLQVDTVENHDIPIGIEDEVFGFLEASLKQHDILLIADNRHGTMTPSLIERAKGLSKKGNVPMVVDTQVSSRWGNLEQYFGVNMICINENEARFFLRDEKSPREKIREEIVHKLNPDRLIIKLKHEGTIGWDKTLGNFGFPAIPVNVVDPIGAGDSFLSAAALSFDHNTGLTTSMFLSNCSGAIAVTKMGTQPTTYQELTSFSLELMDRIGVAA